MSLRRRISGSREERRQARSDRRQERRRAEQAKAAARSAPAAKQQAKGAKRAQDRKPPRRAAASSGAGELVKLGRELIAVPVALWLTAAEFVGGIVLRAWRRVLRPVVTAIWRTLRAAVAFGERHVTPARGVFVACLAAIAGLAASQWLEYHSVRVGIDAYAGDVATIAPAPEIETEIAGNAHSWVMIPLAAGALAAIVAAVSWRRQIGALLIPIGVAVVAITLLNDLPKGLDEGAAALTYEGAKASLLEGFWVQLACAAVLIVCGLLLPRYLAPGPAIAATGPSLIARAGAFASRQAQRSSGATPRKRRRVRIPRPRAKRKVQGAET